MDKNENTISMMPSALPFNKLLYQAVRASSESQSEISSVDSDWSDIRGIALQLGVSDPDELTNERFKVDRQKLENMIKVDSGIDGMNNAEHFFDNIMKTTSTYISWPCRLKIGAKTKKDPHVRILGLPNDVLKAKDRILAALDSRGSRVIMKMDISYTDHSYIIGRGGNNIKKIMETTMTHIHFPDSNRSNPSEKSNQVSLCGSLEGVEKARALVRSSSPLIISFELPIVIPGRSPPTNDTQYVKDVEAKFNIQVIFSVRSKLHSSLVLVKGSEREAAKVQEATQLLINFMCENLANQIQVHLQLEISPHHHDIVKGKNNSQLLSIMERTRTKIIFPDVNDVNIKMIKKSQVTITGSIDGVYRARQQLIGNLPVALIFDYPESTLEPDDIAAMGNKYGVFITVRQKSRQSTMCIVIKGVEKFVDKIYEARHQLLDLQTPLVKPEIPESYFAPKDQNVELAYRQSLAALLSNYPDSPLTPNVQNNFNFNVGSLLAPFQKMAAAAAAANTNGNHLDVPNLQNLQISPNRFQKTTISPNQNGKNILTASTLSSLLPPSQVQNSTTILSQPVSPRTNADTSGYHSFSSSTNSLEQLYAPYHQNARSNSSRLSHFSPENQTSRRMSNGSVNQSFESECRTPTAGYSLTRASDYNTKRIEGFKAMERAPQGELRTPTNAWAGLALSKTSPSALDMAGLSQWTYRDQNSPYKLGSTTGILDSAPPVQDQMQLSQFKDIHSLLNHLKLDHYINNFVVNEIDLEMFTSLTGENLVELGISAFGARKRLLYAINQLNAERSLLQQSFGKFSGSAAPGAERRPSAGW